MAEFGIESGDQAPVIAVVSKASERSDAASTFADSIEVVSNEVRIARLRAEIATADPSVREYDRVSASGVPVFILQRTADRLQKLEGK